MTILEQEKLIQRIMDGEIRPEDIPVFQARFRADPAFRQCYQQHALLSSCLELFSNPGFSKSCEAQASTHARQGRKRMVTSLVWAAAAVLVLSLVARFIYIYPRPDPEIGRLAFADGTRWDLQCADKRHNPNDPTPARTMEPGSTLNLDQGVAEVEFPSGVRAWLGGRSQLAYHGHGNFHLNHGKVWFDIPQGADGVTLTTSRMRVVDQGTEFGVVAGGKLSDEVHVLTGQVLVESLIGRKKTMVVKASRAVTADFVGRIKEHRMDAHTFSREMPQCLPYLHWSFDAQEGGGFATTGEHPRLDTITAQYRTVLATPVDQRSGVGVINRSLRFARSGDRLFTSYPGVSGNTPRTLSFWVRVPPERLRELNGGNWVGMLGWGRRHYPENAFNESIHAIMGAPHLPIPQGSASPGLVPILSFEGIWYEGETDLTDGGWHHLVWSVSGNLGEAGSPGVSLFCDGKPEPLREGGRNPERLWHWPPRLNTVVDNEKSVPVVFGGSLVDPLDLDGVFPGELDEVFVIEGEVGPAEVRRLFLENRYQPAAPQQIPVEKTEIFEKAKKIQD